MIQKTINAVEIRDLVVELEARLANSIAANQLLENKIHELTTKVAKMKTTPTDGMEDHLRWYPGMPTQPKPVITK